MNKNNNFPVQSEKSSEDKANVEEVNTEVEVEEEPQRKASNTVFG